MAIQENQHTLSQCRTDNIEQIFIIHVYHKVHCHWRFKTLETSTISKVAEMSSVNKMVKMPPTSETAEMSPVNNIVDITLQDRII